MQGSASHRTQGTGRAFGYALAVHALAIALLVISFHLPVKSTLYAFHAQRHPMVAELVNSAALAHARQELAAAEARQEQQAQAARRASADARAVRIAREKAQVQAQARAAEARAAAARKAAQLAVEQRQQKLLKRQEQLRARKALDRKRRITQLRQELAAQQEHARRVQARQRAEQALSRQLAEEAHQRAQALSGAEQAVANRYLARIQRQVSLNWVRPPGTAKGLRCVIRVRLLPHGDVISVHVVASSGDPAFDRSVQVAVYRASPLPLPSDPALAATFHRITFTFKPEH
ncbi:MAG: cell envelope integrity protein TolA [Acidiferrobacteraceae bacterium]